MRRDFRLFGSGFAGAADRLGGGFFLLFYYCTPDRENCMQPSSFAEGEDAGGDFVYGIAAYEAVAVDAVDGAAAGVKQPHVVVDFRGCGDGGAGVAGGVFLLDGDGWSEAIDEVNVWFFNTFQELAGVGGERLDVAALAFGVDGVEGEGGFAGAGDTGDDGELSVRDVATYVL